MDLAEQVVKEMKAHPFTLIAVLLLLGFATYAQSQHAKVSDVDEVKQKVDRVLVLQLGEAIRSMSMQICELPSGQSKRVLQRTLDEAQQDYREITGTTYPVPDCRVESE